VDTPQRATPNLGVGPRGLWRFLWLIAAAAALAGCSLDYEDARLDEEFDTDLPEAEFDDAVVTAVRDDGEVRLTAERVRHFPRKQEQHLTNVRFQEISSDGSVVTEGRADEARLYTDSDDVELWGDVELYSVEQEAWIFAEFLRYDHEARVVAGRTDERVRIERDDGSTVSGVDFSAELEFRDVSFGGEVRGTLISRNREDDGGGGGGEGDRSER